MHYTQDVSKFFALNHNSLQKMTQMLCKQFGVNCPEDILQEVYRTIHKRKILDKFDPNHPSGTKISTYLYYHIDKIVRAYRKSNECVIERRSIKKDVYSLDQYSWESLTSKSLEDILSAEYKNIVRQNSKTDRVDSINIDLDLFEKYLQKRNKSYDLSRRKNLSVTNVQGLSLLKVFRLMRKGWFCREIADKYGVSNMFITTIKSEIKKHLIKFGITWKETKPRTKQKEYLNDTELSEYALEMFRYAKKLA
jgi:hypothetical protein